jgi:hypothetical protein
LDIRIDCSTDGHGYTVLVYPHEMAVRGTATKDGPGNVRPLVSIYGLKSGPEQIVGAVHNDAELKINDGAVDAPEETQFQRDVVARGLVPLVAEIFTQPINVKSDVGGTLMAVDR